MKYNSFWVKIIFYILHLYMTLEENIYNNKLNQIKFYIQERIMGLIKKIYYKYKKMNQIKIIQHVVSLKIIFILLFTIWPKNMVSVLFIQMKIKDNLVFQKSYYLLANFNILIMIIKENTECLKFATVFKFKIKKKVTKYAKQ